MKIGKIYNNKIACSRQESTNMSIFLNGQRLLQVNEFFYLGSSITMDGRDEKQIIGRIEGVIKYLNTAKFHI